ncbi:hypothetical protein GCK72_022898 [Caenorhabditis remanei]|uniref:Protein kinase domain-containing protein n=1 Tax=Caenorhabditis remanei TaxID=31234 RepID=A0A6A5FV53_CAERE|nr:hypothetical protein GCK72_022898 [Caenorhabditis remanei]KAF1746442.1 hypothetical protein GCK72_022898 [Caenorhabditis remanei]
MNQSNYITRKKPDTKSTTYDREVGVSKPIVPNILLPGPSPQQLDRSSLRVAMCVPQPSAHLEKTKEDFCSVVTKCYCKLVIHWLLMKPALKFKDLLDFVNGDTICKELRLFLIQHNAMKQSSEPLRTKETICYTDIYSTILKLAANKQKFANFSALLAVFLENFEVSVSSETYRHLASPIEHLEKARESTCVVLTQCYCKLVKYWLQIKPDLPRQFLIQHDGMKKLSKPSSNFVSDQETSIETDTEDNMSFKKLINPENSQPTMLQWSEKTKLDEKKNRDGELVSDYSQAIRNCKGKLKVSSPNSSTDMNRATVLSVSKAPIQHLALSVLPEDEDNFQYSNVAPKNGNNDVSCSRDVENLEQQLGQMPIKKPDNLPSTSLFNREMQARREGIYSYTKHIENRAQRLEENGLILVPIHENQEKCLMSGHSISTSTPMQCFGTTIINDAMEKPKSLRAINAIQNSEQPTSSCGSVDHEQVWEEYRKDDDNTDLFNAKLWNSSEHQETNRQASQAFYQHQYGVQTQAILWESSPMDWQHQQESSYNNQMDYSNGYTSSQNHNEVTDAIPPNDSQQFPPLAPYSHNLGILSQQSIQPTFFAPGLQLGMIQQLSQPHLFPTLPSNIMQHQDQPSRTPIKQENFPLTDITEIIKFQGFLGEEKLILNDYLTMLPNWFSTRMVRFAVAKIMETVVQPERIQWLDSIFEAIGSKIFEDYRKEKLCQIEARIQDKCWTLLDHRPTLKRRNLFNKELLIGSFIYEKHFMLFAIRNPNGAITEESETENSPSPMCSVYFLDPMGDFIGYRNRRALLMVSIFMECHFTALKKNKILPEATVFHKTRVVLKRIANLPLQSNFCDCGPSVVSYVETLLDNRWGLLQLNIDGEVDWHQMDQNGENSIDMSRRKVRSMMKLYILPQYRRGVLELEKLQERRQMKVTASNSSINTPIVIRDRFVLNKCIGQGAFGQVFSAYDMETGNHAIVMKFTLDAESFNNENNFLDACHGTRGFPKKVSDFNFILRDQTCYSIVQSYEGFSFNKVFAMPNVLQQPSNVLKIGYRLFLLLEKMHQMGFVHRDVHASNITVDNNWEGELEISLIDFGRTRPSIPPPESVDERGRHLSLNVLLGERYEPHDDLISMVFSLMTFFRIRTFTDEELVAQKQAFHEDPMSYFPTEDTQWVGRLYLYINSQRNQPYDREGIVDIFRSAIDGVKPTDPISFRYFDRLFWID